MAEYLEKIDRIRLPIVPLNGIVLFPQNSASIEVSDETALAGIEEAMKHDGLAFFVLKRLEARRKNTKASFYTVGIVGKIKQTIRTAGNAKRIIVEGQSRAALLSLKNEDSLITGDLLTKTVYRRDNGGITGEACLREADAAFDKLLSFLPKLSEEVTNAVRSIEDIGLKADFIACHVLVRPNDKQKILEEYDPLERLRLVIGIMTSESYVLSDQKKIHDKVQERLNQNQKDYVLREQLKAIREELGDDGPSEIEEYEARVREADLPDEVREKLNKEIARLAKTPFGSAEGGVQRNYLDTCLELPWNTYSAKKEVSLAKAGKILNADHDGLEKVKDRILEYLAVAQTTDRIGTQILCLVGAPGVGKTSIGASIARALGRKYVRVSLGGIRDEADIRGHRKTYIGSMPGRIIDALIRAGTKDPVILLDEIDKLSQSINGDPASALLEVLDPEQNKNFRDHFIELPFDLSKCVFIATANTLETVPRPLIDRMEIIEMKSYTKSEKIAIAKHHLIPKQLEKCGLTKRQIRFREDAIIELIDYDTREAGVRNLEREIASILRKCARRFAEDASLSSLTVSEKTVRELLGSRQVRPTVIAPENEIGVVNGLAYTQVGGDLLKIEVAVFEGEGKLELTGSLGDVMKESAQIAYSYVRSQADKLGIPTDFYKTKDLHIHVPEGATPKDGPSAGVTLVTAIASALSGRPVRREIAMTGEVTLRGHVLAIGGLREKTMAAYNAGVTTVLIPKDNLPDLEEIDPVVRRELHFIPVTEASEILEAALLDTAPTTEEKITAFLPLETVLDRPRPAPRL